MKPQTTQSCEMATVGYFYDEQKDMTQGDPIKVCAKMNIYKFLNSRDIRDYLIETKYEFAPDEALFVILTSRNSTVGEKQTALSELADAFPDFIVEKRRSDIKKKNA